MKRALLPVVFLAACGAAPTVTPDASFRAVAPTVAPPPPLVFPALHEKQLANGLRVRFVVDKRLPLAELALVAPPHPANRRERAADEALFALIAEALADGSPAEAVANGRALPDAGPPSLAAANGRALADAGPPSLAVANGRALPDAGPPSLAAANGRALPDAGPPSLAVANGRALPDAGPPSLAVANGRALGLSVSASSRALRVNVAGALAAQAMDLLAETIISKRFSEGDLGRYKRRARADELVASVDPFAVAGNAIGALLPPNGAWAADDLPVRELTGNDLEAARRRLLRPEGALLVVAGDVEEDKWLTFLEKRLGSWKGPGALLPAEPPDVWHQRTAKILLIDDGSSEAALLTPVAVFAPGVTFDDPDRAALELASATLSRGSSSRLFQHLRSEQGATYGAFGRFRPGRLPGAIVVGASVRSDEVTASLKTIFQEIEHLRTVEISDVERAGRVEAMNNEELASLGSLSGQVSAAIEDWQLGVPNSQASRAGARRLVTPAALRSAAARYLAPDQLRVVVVGSAKLRPALEATNLGEVTVANAAELNMAQSSTFERPKRSVRPPEEIQRAVREHFGIFRRCYESGLRTDPRLQGTVSTHFVIEADGRVSAAEFVPTEDRLKDKAVQDCVVAGFLTLAFGSAPGKVTVTYPIIFNPGD